MISTTRLILRKLTLIDAPFILSLVNDPAWLQYIGDKGVRNLEDARRYLIEGPIKSYQTYGFGLYLVELKDQTPIGMCGLIKRENLNSADIGFAYMPNFRGKGYGYEAAIAVIEEAENTFKMKRLLGLTSLDNHASIGLLEKLGFSFLDLISMNPNKPNDKDTRLFCWEAN